MHHEGWGNCILSTDGEYQGMGGVLFDTEKEVFEAFMELYTRPKLLTAEELERLEG